MAGATIEQLIAATAAETTVVYGVTRTFLAHVLAESARARPGRRSVVVTPDEDTARRLHQDIGFFMPPASLADDALPSLHLPMLDTSPYTELRPDQSALVGRMATLFRLAHGAALGSPIVVLSAVSLLRKVMPREQLLALSGEFSQGQELDRDQTIRLLTAAGYTRSTIVEDPGTFAVRGGVIDVFVPLYRYPVRVDLFGDTIESLRFYDPDSQRTLRAVPKVQVHPVRETIATRGADIRARILAAADRANMPSRERRKVLDRLEGGEPFLGIETLTPAFHERLVPLWQYLSDADQAPLCWFIDPDGIRQQVADELEIAESRFQVRLDDGKLAFAPDEHYLSRDEVADALQSQSPRIEARTLEVLAGRGSLEAQEDGEPGSSSLRFLVDDNRNLRADMERTRRQSADELMAPLVAEIRAWQKDDWRIVIAAGSLARARQLQTLLVDYECATRIRDTPETPPLAELEPGRAPTILPSRVSRGFALPTDKVVLLSAEDIFGARRQGSRRQRAAARRARKALMGGVADFSLLSPGDHVVHDVHGVGRYLGLAKLAAVAGGPEIDFLHLEYTGGTLYLPVYRLAAVHRYVGADGHGVKLDRLGGVTWGKTRRKVSEKVAALAEELLQIYAQRAALPGFAFPPADAMYREFEATFPFEETPDQQQAIDDVLADMESERPMERLVCGDVGYGKTEVALRAMFKAVLGGKQAALLAPTTVLVEQHYQTMRERFRGWPVEVGKLSRFQGKKERVQVITGLAAGTVDMVVGTHRLLSKDVRFKELGLLVIDEEQRFGVAHKEKLRRVRTQIDALTLTATPIPRTLHLAMAGLRDLSIIATPPADRRAVRTFIAREDDDILRQAVRRELGRGGQVFFVCPRIDGGRPTKGKGRGRFGALPTRSVGEWAAHLRELLPEARVGVAHGQMTATALEQAMVGFVNGDFDILVSTTIIENGLDIPRANTMFIERADVFGLSQLYQLRGRIGRSSERAFCYLLVPPLEKLSSDARRRLEALQRFTELGAGFQIASHDLEIRGGGELLGAKQSGAIAAVGFEAYVAMLDAAVARLRGQDGASEPRTRALELNVDVPGYIPDDYVPDPGQRLDLYKRLSDAESEEEIEEIMTEIADRYGNPPIEVLTLGDLMSLACLARRLHAQSLELSGGRMVLALAEDTPLSPEQLVELVADKRFRLTPDMRLSRRFTEDEKRDVMGAARQCLLGLLARVRRA